MCHPEDGGMTELADVLSSSDQMLGQYVPRCKVGTLKASVRNLLTTKPPGFTPITTRPPAPTAAQPGHPKKQPGLKHPTPIPTAPHRKPASSAVLSVPPPMPQPNHGNRGAWPPPSQQGQNKAEPPPKALPGSEPHVSPPGSSGGVSPPKRFGAVPQPKVEGNVQRLGSPGRSRGWSPPAAQEWEAGVGPDFPKPLLHAKPAAQPPPPWATGHGGAKVATARGQARLPSEPQNTGSEPRRRSRSLGPPPSSPAAPVGDAAPDSSSSGTGSPRPERVIPRPSGRSSSPPRRRALSEGPPVNGPSKYVTPSTGAARVSHGTHPGSAKDADSAAAAAAATSAGHPDPPRQDPPAGSPLPWLRTQSLVTRPSDRAAKPPPASPAAGTRGPMASAFHPKTPAVADSPRASVPTTASRQPKAAPSAFCPVGPPSQPPPPSLSPTLGPADLSPSPPLQQDPPDEPWALPLRRPAGRKSPSRRLSFDDDHLTAQSSQAKGPAAAQAAPAISYHTSHYNITSYPISSRGMPIYDDTFRAKVSASGELTTLPPPPSPKRKPPSPAPSPSDTSPRRRLSPFAGELAEQERLAAQDVRPPSSASGGRQRKPPAGDLSLEARFPRQRSIESSTSVNRPSAYASRIEHGASIPTSTTSEADPTTAAFGFVTRHESPPKAPAGAAYVYKISDDISPPQTLTAPPPSAFSPAQNSLQADASALLRALDDLDLSTSNAPRPLPRSRSVPQLHSSIVRDSSSAMEQGYVHVETLPLRTKVELNLPNSSSVRMYPVPLGTVNGSAAVPSHVSPAHTSSLALPLNHVSATPWPLNYAPTHAGTGRPVTSLPPSQTSNVYAPQMASYVRPMSPPQLQATKSSDYPQDPARLPLQQVPALLRPGGRLMTSVNAPSDHHSRQSPEFPTSAPWPGGPGGSGPAAFARHANHRKEPMPSGKSPRRTDPAALSATIADYNVQYAKWKATVPRPIQGPTLPSEWVFQVGDVLEITPAQTPSLSGRDPVAREFSVMNPSVLRLLQVTLAHYPGANSWVLQAVAPGQTDVVYTEINSETEKAERRFVACIL